ncbi:thioredoxin family protein [Desulfobulbus sp. US2]|nr:thioredoxin family protein [Desulfobulbus sp. US2]
MLDYTEQRRGKGGDSRRYIITSFLLIFFVLISLTLGRDCSAMIDFQWSGDGIAWKGYSEGLAQAKREGKPAIIIFYSESCSACKRYKGILQEQSIIDASASFVMIRVNTRRQPKLSEKYLFDGRYVREPLLSFLTARSCTICILPSGINILSSLSRTIC